MKRLILKVSILTFFAIMVSLGITYGAFTIFAPHLLGSICETLGANSRSLYFYEKEYNRNQSTTNLYRVLNKAIVFENNSKIVEYFEKFYAEEDYEQNIDTINEANYNPEGSVLENISLSNADNRLKTKYVKALCEEGKFEDAFAFAKQDLTELDDENVNFVFAGMAEFLNEQNCEVFDTQGVALNIYNYYTNVKTIYENSLTANKDKFALGSLANRLLVITSFMETLAPYVEDVNYSAENIITIKNYASELKIQLATFVG